MLYNVPLVDCHIHYGGSCTVDFVWWAINYTKSYYLAESYDDVLESMTFAPDEPRTFHRFLKKFSILDQINWDPILLDRSVYYICNALEDQGISKVWMRLSINKYLNTIKWHRWELIKYIRDCFDKYLTNTGVDLILSVKYETEKANQRQLLSLIDDERVAENIIGIDFVGDESYYDAKFIKPLLDNWKSAGKLLFAHVGESCSAENIRSAIEIGITEICHGIKAIDHPDIISLAIDNDICFHLALSSNYYTGVVAGEHPIKKLLLYGVKCTIGTDDPVQCNTTLAGEYKLASEMLSSINGKDYIHLLQTTAAERVGIL